MQTILVVFHLFLSLGLVGLILIQHGKGADMGAAFGSGASATVFGARGSASFLSRTTAALATLFFLTSMTLAYFSSKSTEAPGLMDQLASPPVAEEVQLPPSEVPVAPMEDAVPARGEPRAAVDVPVVPAPQEAVPAVPGPARIRIGARKKFRVQADVVELVDTPS